MGLSTRLIENLHASAASLDTSLAERAGLHSVALVGSLSRDDFNEGGSDVDLLFVHGLGEKGSEVASLPEFRAVIQHFGEPLLRLGMSTGRQKPFLVDCHFADRQTVCRQPDWADPAGFLREYLSRDRYLWIYAFDFVENSLPLWGPDLRPAVRVYDPVSYLPMLTRSLREDLARLQSLQPVPEPPAKLINDWKHLSGQLSTLLSLKHGCRSLMKQALHRCFNLSVPYFDGKDFAASLWAEYLYGSVFQDRADWVRRCSRFCAGALKALAP
ncbi:MAG: nucleotidyltransferase domain-containing protein [Armatimonadia bacterium]